MIRIVFDFLWVSILTSLLLGLIATIIPALGTSGTAVGTLTGAMVSGQLYGRRARAVASKGYAWQVALVVTVVTLALTALVVYALRQSGNLAELGEISWNAYAIGVAFVGLITLFIVRFFFRWGSKTGAKSVGGAS